MQPASPISVVVLTHNRRDQLLDTLARLDAHAPGVPAIVVDNAGSDGTPQAVRERFPRVRLLRAPANLGAAGRNLGVLAARSPYVAFCDDDTCWEPGALPAAVRLFERLPRAGVLNGRILVGDQGRVDPTCRRMAASPLGPGPEGTMRLIGFMAGASIFRTRAFLEASGYCERLFIGGEEALLALDLAARGWDMLYAPGLLIRHRPSPLRDAPRRARLLARNAIWTAWMRLPARDAWRETRSRLRSAREAGVAAQVAASALAGLPWVLRQRATVPDDVLDMLLRVTGWPGPAREGTLR